MADNKIKITELPKCDSTQGLTTLGVNNLNQSVKVPLGGIIAALEETMAALREECAELAEQLGKVKQQAQLAKLCQDDGICRYAPYIIRPDGNIYEWAETDSNRSVVFRPLPGVCYELSPALLTTGTNAIYCRLDPAASHGIEVVKAVWQNSNLLQAPADIDYDFCAVGMDKTNLGIAEWPAESELYFHATSHDRLLVVSYDAAEDVPTVAQPNATAAEPYDIVWATNRKYFVARRLEGGAAVYYRNWPSRGTYMTGVDLYSATPDYIGRPRADVMYRGPQGQLQCIIDNDLKPLIL